MYKQAKKKRRPLDEPTCSDSTLLLDVEDLIHIAMGPADKNIVNFKLLQTILFILARHTRMLEQRVEVRVAEFREGRDGGEGRDTSTSRAPTYEDKRPASDYDVEDRKVRKKSPAKQKPSQQKLHEKTKIKTREPSLKRLLREKSTPPASPGRKKQKATDSTSESDKDTGRARGAYYDYHDKDEKGSDDSDRGRDKGRRGRSRAGKEADRDTKSRSVKERGVGRDEDLSSGKESSREGSRGGGKGSDRESRRERSRGGAREGARDDSREGGREARKGEGGEGGGGKERKEKRRGGDEERRRRDEGGRGRDEGGRGRDEGGRGRGREGKSETDESTDQDRASGKSRKGGRGGKERSREREGQADGLGGDRDKRRETVAEGGRGGGREEEDRSENARGRGAGAKAAAGAGAEKEKDKKRKEKYGDEVEDDRRGYKGQKEIKEGGRDVDREEREGRGGGKPKGTKGGGRDREEEDEVGAKGKKKVKERQPSRTGLTASEVTRDKEKILQVDRVQKPKFAKPIRVGSVEVVSQKQFGELEQIVRALKDKASLPPPPTMPDNKKLRTAIKQGSASLTDTMQAMNLSARVQAAEMGIKNMGELLTQLAASGALPKDIAGMVKGEVEAAQRSIAAIARTGAGGVGGPGGGPGGQFAGGPGGQFSGGPGGQFAGGPGGGPGGQFAGGPGGGPGGQFAGGPGGGLGGQFAGGPGGGPSGQFAGGPGGGPGGQFAGGPGGGPGGQFAGGPGGQFAGGPGGQFAGGPGGRPGGQFAGGPAGQFAGGPGGQFAGGPEGQFAGGPVGQFAGGPGGQFAGGPGGQFAGGPGSGPSGQFVGGQGGQFAGGQGGQSVGQFAPGPGGQFAGQFTPGPGGQFEGQGLVPSTRDTVAAAKTGAPTGQAGVGGGGVLVPPPVYCITQADLNRAMEYLRGDLLQKMGALTTRANQTAENASKQVHELMDNVDVALGLNERITDLHSIVSDYAEQLAGFDTGLTTQLTGFQEQVTVLRNDLNAGLSQLEQVNNNAETAAVLELTERYECLVNDLNTTLHAHQGLTSYQRQLSDELKALIEAVEMMREQKADRDEVLDGLRDKADNSRLEGLLTEDKFAIAREELEMRMQMCYDKFRKQDSVWMNVVHDFTQVTDSKAELMQLLGVRDDAQKQLQDLLKKVQKLEKLLGEPKAAVITRQLAKDAVCASCRVPALMEAAPPNPPPALPYARPVPQGAPAEAPSEICLRNLNMEEPSDEPLHMCQRWVGGSHTMMGPAGRGSVSREQAAAPAQSHLGIKRYLGTGTDGKLYKFEEGLEPCVQCNLPRTVSPKRQVSEEHMDKLPGEPELPHAKHGEGDQVHHRKVTLVDTTTARRVTIVDDSLLEYAEDEKRVTQRRTTYAGDGERSRVGEEMVAAAPRVSVVLGDPSMYPSQAQRSATITRSTNMAERDIASRVTAVGVTVQGSVTPSQDEKERNVILGNIARVKGDTKGEGEVDAAAEVETEIEQVKLD